MNKELKIKKKRKDNTATRNLRSNGFTMIELLVSTGLFVVLISIASGSFIQALRTQRIVTNLSISMNDASFVIEQIAREIRVGFNFSTTNNGKNIKFNDPSGKLVEYRFVNEGIERCEGGCKIITSPDVRIDNLKFILKGNASGDGLPPRVTILISVIGDKEIKIHLQTTISSRILDT